MNSPRTRSRKIRNKLGWVLLALLLLLNNGCLGVVAGVAAVGGAATVGYFYVRGEAIRDYPVSMERAHAAVLAGLTEMQLQEVRQREKPADPNKITVETRLTDGTLARINLTAVGPLIPADGPVTRIGVRISPFGNEELSIRFQDTFAKYLAPAVPLQPPVGVPPNRPVGPPPAIGPTGPVETMPPPMAK